MSGENQRSPFQRYINKFTEKKIADELVLTGYALPCQVVTVMGSIVTVSFQINTPNQTTTLPNVTVPVEGSEYVRLPIQVGCKGWVKPADARLGGVTGLGTGTADLTRPANLGALVFAPLGNKNFTPPTDPNKIEIYGPAGFIARSQNGNVSVVGTQTSLVLTVGAINITVDGTAIIFNGPVVFNGTVSGIEGGGGTVNFGNANVTTTGTITSNGVVLSTHLHSGVSTGIDDTGPPT